METLFVLRYFNFNIMQQNAFRVKLTKKEKLWGLGRISFVKLKLTMSF